MSESIKTKIFISYSHEENGNSTVADDIWDLAVKFRNNGIEAIIDQDFGEDGAHPDIGWMKWMENNIETSDYIIIFCTEMYYAKTRDKVEVTAGRGVKREWLLIDTEIYDNGKYGKYIPITYKNDNNQYIPKTLKTNCSSYQIDNDENVNELIKILTGQKKRLPPINNQLKNNLSQKDEQLRKLFVDIENQKHEKEFIELVSTYIEPSHIFYDKSYYEKIKYLYSQNIDNSSKFVCILKRLKQTESIQQAITVLEKKYGKPECNKIKILYDTLAIAIHPKNNDYAISFYGQNNSKEQSYTEFSDVVSKDKIIDKLSEKINNLVDNKTELANIKTLVLILPNELLDLDYKEIKKSKSYIYDVNIIIKLRDRGDSDTKQLRWEENWKLYEDKKNKKVSEISFPYNQNDTTLKIDKDIREAYPLMLMNCQMTPDISKAILDNGISIILYPQKGFEYKTGLVFKRIVLLSSLFQNKVLEDLIQDVNKHIRQNLKNENLKKRSHISLIWDDPNTLPTNIKNQERDSL